MLPLSDELQAAVMSSIDVRAELSPEDLPSAVLYTFVNTHKSLHCVTTSEDGTLVAGGLFLERQPAALPAALLTASRLCRRCSDILLRPLGAAATCLVHLFCLLCIA